MSYSKSLAGFASFLFCKTAIVSFAIICPAKELDTVLHIFAIESPIGNALVLSLDSFCRVHSNGPVRSRVGSRVRAKHFSHLESRIELEPVLLTVRGLLPHVKSQPEFPMPSLPGLRLASLQNARGVSTIAIVSSKRQHPVFARVHELDHHRESPFSKNQRLVLTAHIR